MAQVRLTSLGLLSVPLYPSALLVFTPVNWLVFALFTPWQPLRSYQGQKYTHKIMLACFLVWWWPDQCVLSYLLIGLAEIRMTVNLHIQVVPFFFFVHISSLSVQQRTFTNTRFEQHRCLVCPPSDQSMELYQWSCLELLLFLLLFLIIYIYIYIYVTMQMADNESTTLNTIHAINTILFPPPLSRGVGSRVYD